MQPGRLPDPLAGLRDLLERNLQGIAANLQRAGSQAAEACAQALRPLQAGSAPLLASVSARLGGAPAGARAASARAAQPLFDLGFNPEEIKARLASVPVWVVVNAKQEFVLMTGEEEESRQLGLFFFSEAEAESLLQTVKRMSPKMGKEARVARTTMDRVYHLASQPRSEGGLEGVSFRFVPDPHQVERALELYKHAGVPVDGFPGVPLFQAEGLTVKGEKSRYTPLFFSKDDLDAALGAAHSAKDAAAAAETRAKAERARGEAAEARGEAAAAANDRERRAASKRAEAAEQRLAKYEQRLAETEAAARQQQKLPRVDVGSLEEVLARMEADTRGEWADVLLVPAASVAAPEAPPPKAGKKKK